jgi:hypothetical protein
MIRASFLLGRNRAPEVAWLGTWDVRKNKSVRNVDHVLLAISVLTFVLCLGPCLYHVQT